MYKSISNNILFNLNKRYFSSSSIYNKSLIYNNVLSISQFNSNSLIKHSNNNNNKNNSSSIINNNNNNRQHLYNKRNYTSTKQLDNSNLFDKGGNSDYISIDGYSQQGFSANGVLIPGSVVAVPNLLLLWDVHQADEITVDSMSALSVIEPAAEFVIIGTGEQRITLEPELIDEMRKKYSVNIEIMSTVNALGTYNILAEEGRRVAAFLIPNEPCREAKDPYYVSKKDYTPISNEGALSSHASPNLKQSQQYLQQKQTSETSATTSTTFKEEYKPTKNQEETKPTKLTISGKFIVWIAEKLAKKKK